MQFGKHAVANTALESGEGLGPVVFMGKEGTKMGSPARVQVASSLFEGACPKQ